MTSSTTKGAGGANNPAGETSMTNNEPTKAMPIPAVDSDPTGAVAESLYDIDTTGRLRESPQDVDEYRRRATSFAVWLGRRGYRVVPVATNGVSVPAGMVEPRVYIAARFSRRPECNALGHVLKARGCVITSRWTKPDCDHVLPTGLSRQAEDSERQRYALEDVEDMRAANWTISFMEEPRSNTRGGRHIEFGIAVALGHRLTIIGPRETVFHHLPNVEQYDTVENFVASLPASLSTPHPSTAGDTGSGGVERDADPCVDGSHCCCCSPGEPCCDCGVIMPSKVCIGENCWCGAPAAKKVGEEILFDDPTPARHNLTAYVCAAHYAQMMGPLGAQQMGLAALSQPATTDIPEHVREIMRPGGRPTFVSEVSAEREAAIWERCAEICEQQAKDFLSPQYATGQPVSSIQERFACKECADAIRKESYDH